MNQIDSEPFLKIDSQLDYHSTPSYISATPDLWEVDGPMAFIDIVFNE